VRLPERQRVAPEGEPKVSEKGSKGLGPGQRPALAPEPETAPYSSLVGVPPLAPSWQSGRNLTTLVS
jgi:hypothetical protein